MNTPTEHTRPSSTTTIVIHTQKDDSLVVAFFLTLFFGPLGMFYTTVVGAFVMLGVFVIIIPIIAVMTLGLGGFLWIPAWFICMAWGMLAAKRGGKPIVETLKH